MRLRTQVTTTLPLMVLVALFALDPDSGLGIKVFSPTTTVIVLKYLSSLFILSGAFWFLKLMLDYPEADTRGLFKQVELGNPAAGSALVARSIFFFAIVWAISRSVQGAELPYIGDAGRGHVNPPMAVANSRDVGAYIPNQAYTYAPLLKIEQVRFWRAHGRPEMLAALVEQESCPSLTSSICWNPASRLKSAREEGAGMGQITRAYRKDGTERFDALSELVGAHSELAGLTWENVYLSPELQLRAIVLKSLDSFKALSMIKDAILQLDFTDGAYNAGGGTISTRRRVCGLKAGCDPQIWFGNVEKVCLTGAVPIYGKRTACDIVQDHVNMVSRIRSPKYKALML